MKSKKNKKFFKNQQKNKKSKKIYKGGTESTSNSSVGSLSSLSLPSSNLSQESLGDSIKSNISYLGDTIQKALSNSFKLKSSPKASPEASPEASPTESLKESPEASPKALPKASPKVSSEASPEASPTESLKESPEASPIESLKASPIQSPQMAPEASPEALLKSLSSKSIPKSSPKQTKKLKILVKTKKSDKKLSIEDSDTLKDFYDKIEDIEDLSEKEKSYNKFLDKKELLNRIDILDNDNYDYLYPSLDDPNFNIKITEKKEFFDTKNDIKIKDVKIEADKICNITPELAPHQQFVRNFLSFQTPYNSLLLYHGLGTGKTCAAISVAEEQREYLMQLNLNQRIIIVASPNVQENFKLQLFDERKLELIDGIWNIKNCVGNKFIKEINPNSMMGLSKELVIKQIKNLINNYYLFLGYIEFSNFIAKKSEIQGETSSKKISQKLKKYFNNRLIIIDEVHNIRISDDNQNKRVAQELFKLVKQVDTLRLLLLSATPMYNSYKEIIWLINLMNLNDRRSQIKVKDVFDSNGNFVEVDGNEIGKDLLKRKATGYISYVMGENPYSFPYKIWPMQFSPENSIINKNFGDLKTKYPTIQLNNKKIVQPLEHLDIYLEKIGSYQEKVYNYIVTQLKNSLESNTQTITFENMETFGYITLQKPLEALNMTYPLDILDEYIEEEKYTLDSKDLVGKNGLNRIMKYSLSTAPPSRSKFIYKDLNFGRIFSPTEIGKYSKKIKKICDNIINSTGVVLIYSQYIDGGVLPVALALEELGFTRYGNTKSLFETPPVEMLDVNTYKPKSDVEGSKFKPAKYIMITGDKYLSPDTINDIKGATNPDNKYGEKVKVILISQAGSEGIDFKFIRQVHILEPWYNMNRIEQIIGRGVRNCSHKDLPFIERNVEIFLHGTQLSSNQEAVDLYVYRLAELKAVQIGKVSRLLKEISVDCILNISQNNFNEDILKQKVEQKLSNNEIIEYNVGNKPYTAICDYMESCQYKCDPDKNIESKDVKNFTYSESFIIMNNEKIIERIKQLIKEKYFYYKVDLVNLINLYKIYPIEQIDYALTQLVNDKNEFVIDKYNRLGHLINIDDLYIFQPIELTNKDVSLYDRTTPIYYKRNKLNINSIKDLIKEEVKEEKIEEQEDLAAKNIIKELYNNYLIGTQEQLVLRGEKNYYKYMSLVFKELSKEISLELLEYFLISHLLEMLSFDELIILLNYLYYNKLTDFENKLKEYFDKQILKNKKIEGLLLNDKGKQKLIIKQDKYWKNAESEDYVDLSENLKSLLIPIDKYNNILGFIGDFKNDYNIFKVKLLEKKRNKGARCDQASKKESIDTLNNILDDEKYTSLNTSNINHIQICIYQEIYLRYFNEIKKNDKIWFLTPGVAILNNIEKINR